MKHEVILSNSVAATWFKYKGTSDSWGIAVITLPYTYEQHLSVSITGVIAASLFTTTGSTTQRAVTISSVSTVTANTVSVQKSAPAHGITIGY